jgi:hypothetical protein
MEFSVIARVGFHRWFPDPIPQLYRARPDKKTSKVHDGKTVA